MKLYEYEVNVDVRFVVAAESEEDARKRIEGWSAEGIVRCGDIIGAGDAVSDSHIELQEVRELSSSDPSDESHAVAM